MREMAMKAEQDMGSDRAKNIRNWGLAVKEWVAVLSGILTLAGAAIVLHEKIQSKSQ